VFITRRIPVNGLDSIFAVTQARVWEGDLPPTRPELLSAIVGCAGVLTLLTDRVDPEFLDRAGPGLLVVSNLAVGYDNIDVAACSARGVAVGNTPGVLTEATADFAFALILAAARRIPEASRFVLAGQWQAWDPLLLLGSDVGGATIGIVGFGRIGQAVARRARGFGMEILYASRTPADDALEAELGARQVPLAELLSRSDFVSLHVSLSPATHHLIDAAALARMKPTAILINTARGAVVDSAALHAALRDRRIAGAALDVTDPEPLPLDDPLMGLDNCLIVPHVASATTATRNRMAAMAAANLIAGLRGEALPTPVLPP
jgi:lactate dehydrogenase-like 2-hydroxyacid dehydrogenase